MIYTPTLWLCFFTEPELRAIEIYIAEIGIVELIVPVILNKLVQMREMTFTYELHPHFLEIYRMCKYELPPSRLSNLIV